MLRHAIAAPPVSPAQQPPSIISASRVWNLLQFGCLHLSTQQCRILLDTARAVIRSELGGQFAILPVTDDPDLEQLAGCFVSLHTSATHKLRGCVGRIDASRPLIQAVRHAAAQVLTDPRFAADPVQLEELGELELELSVLSPPHPAEHPLAFNPLEQGIYLTVGKYTGCFLPQVARETGWTREQLLTRLCVEKMGLPPDAWKQQDARLQVFSTLVIGPEPFELPSVPGRA